MFGRALLQLSCISDGIGRRVHNHTCSGHADVFERIRSVPIRLDISRCCACVESSLRSVPCFLLCKSDSEMSAGSLWSAWLPSSSRPYLLGIHLRFSTRTVKMPFNSIIDSEDWFKFCSERSISTARAFCCGTVGVVQPPGALRAGGPAGDALLDMLNPGELCWMQEPASDVPKRFSFLFPAAGR